MHDPALSEDWKAKYESCVFKQPATDQSDSKDAELPYLMLRPESYDPQRQYPLVLFLHGAGERGSDNQKQLIHGLVAFAQPKAMKKRPCFVLAPQCPEDMQWVDTPWTAKGHSMPTDPAPALALSIELLKDTVARFSIDPQRIYVTGLSMGGFGTWDALQRYPHMFTAAIPICGGGDETLAESIAHVPVWAFHGQDDSVVLPIRSRNMVKALKAAGGTPKYTEYPAVQHDSWTDTYANEEVHEWLFQQKSKPSASNR